MQIPPNYLDDNPYTPKPAGMNAPTEEYLTRGYGISVIKDKKGDYIIIGKKHIKLKDILKAINKMNKKYNRAQIKKLTSKEINDFILLYTKKKTIEEIFGKPEIKEKEIKEIKETKKIPKGARGSARPYASALKKELTTREFETLEKQQQFKEKKQKFEEEQLQKATLKAKEELKKELEEKAEYKKIYSKVVKAKQLIIGQAKANNIDFDEKAPDYYLLLDELIKIGDPAILGKFETYKIANKTKNQLLNLKLKNEENKKLNPDEDFDDDDVYEKKEEVEPIQPVEPVEQVEQVEQEPVEEEEKQLTLKEIPHAREIKTLNKLAEDYNIEVPQDIKKKGTYIRKKLLEELTPTQQFMFGNGFEESGLSNFDIDEVFVNIPEYIGTVPYDLLHLLKPTQEKINGCIINNQSSHQPGEHWQALAWKPYEFCFYDSFGRYPSPEVKIAIDKFIERLPHNNLMKIKYNKIADQSTTSKTCGLFCIKFLMNIFRDKSFAEASGFSNSITKNENEMNKLAEKLNIE